MDVFQAAYKSVLGFRKTIEVIYGVQENSSRTETITVRFFWRPTMRTNWSRDGV